MNQVQELAVTQPTPAVPTTQNEELRLSLEQYMDRNRMGLKAVAQAIGGTSDASVSRYLHRVYSGNVAKLEAKISDLLRNEGLSEKSENELFENAISKQLATVFRVAIGRQYINVIFGPAGIGKTCAIELYLRANPRTVLIKGAEFCSSVSDVESALFNWEPNREWRGNTKRIATLIPKFKNSQRLIIVDNAHLLTCKAIGWLISFWQETHAPMVLIGNPEIRQKLLRTDQWHSRIGNCYELQPPRKTLHAIAEVMLGQLAPELERETGEFRRKVLAVVQMIVEREGAFRSLCKRLVDARSRVGKRDDEGQVIDWVRALKDTCNQSLYHYSFGDERNN